MRWAVAAVLLTGCVSIPAFRGSGDDAGADTPDGSIGPLAVRHIANAYREGGSDGQAFGTYMMTKAGYSIPTAGIVDGDLVLFIANVDNGSNDFWNLPTGFTPILQRFYGQDGQTYVAGWKIAASEPQTYAGMYKVGVSSSSAATVSLLAVTGYDPQSPIEFAVPTDHQTPTNPADIGSAGLSTTADNSLLIYAAGADWTPENGQNTYELPSGFQLLTFVGDRGDTPPHWDWTCQVIAYKLQATKGASGPLTGTMTGVSFSDGTTPIPGGGWDLLFAIAPHS
ncbi:MAG TPA: hypothetical protein VFV99_07005 [Kofleriaceae bacterium]|nr:hypothetical protein [Kofleriaceae bacterium]